MSVNYPIKILVVEDCTVNRFVICKLLNNDSRTVVVGEATDGKSSIDEAIKLSPDIVLMDLGLPIMDGIEATRHIKYHLPGTKVVVLTSHDETDAMQASLSAGADKFCLKEELYDTLIQDLVNVFESQSDKLQTSASLTS